jgi:hypothetical protein
MGEVNNPALRCHGLDDPFHDADIRIGGSEICHKNDQRGGKMDFHNILAALFGEGHGCEITKKRREVNEAGAIEKARFAMW